MAQKFLTCCSLFLLLAYVSALRQADFDAWLQYRLIFAIVAAPQSENKAHTVLKLPGGTLQYHYCTDIKVGWNRQTC